MLYSYYLGLDLGQKNDYTAISIIEEPVWIPEWLARDHRTAFEFGLEPRKTRAGWLAPDKVDPRALPDLLELNRREGRPAAPPLLMPHLERIPLGTPYPLVVQRVGMILASPPLADRPTALVVDGTGVGVGIVDMFVHAGLYPIPISIHGGDRVIPTHPGFRVPKRDLVAAVQVLLQNEQLKISRALLEAETLKRELENFRVKLDPVTAHDSYSHWREAEHDDLVLAAALAAWFRAWWNSNLDTSNALVTRR